jgi:membrane protease YdiL (CAAX protease family)
VEQPSRRALRVEIVLVLGVSLGASAVYAMISLIGKLTAGRSLSSQSATLNASRAPGRPWLDLSLQLADVLFGVVPALLAAHLLARDRERARAALDRPWPGGPVPTPPGTDVLGVRPLRPGFDLATAAGLAAVIGIPGLGLYFAARALGLNATVIPEALPHVWWAVPVLVLSAAQNGLVEEVVVVGYLVTRLRQLDLPLPLVIAASATLRGSYHLYQGFGAFLGNAVMGVVFALFFLRYRRVGPLVVAHTLLDVVAFVGYTLLHGHLSLLS